MLLRIMRRADYSDDSDEQIEMIPAQKQIPKIQLKQWIHSVSHGQAQNGQFTKQIILNFFIQQGYYELAQTFSEQSGIPMGKWINEEEVRARYQVKALIRNGQIDQAMQEIEKIDPQFGNKKENQSIIFMLKSLKVINLIKKNQLEAAIIAGKSELMPFTLKNNEKYLPQIEKVMSLIAFINVKNCPHSVLATQQHSNSIANKVNKLLLEMSTKENSEESKKEQKDNCSGQSLESVMKLGKWCEDQLGNYLQFPHFNFSSNQEIFKESP